MRYADVSELVAELILHPHPCGPDCLCWKLRRIEGIDEALSKLDLDQLQAEDKPATGE